MIEGETKRRLRRIVGNKNAKRIVASIKTPKLLMWDAIFRKNKEQIEKEYRIRTLQLIVQIWGWQVLTSKQKHILRKDENERSVKKAIPVEHLGRLENPD